MQILYKDSHNMSKFTFETDAWQFAGFNGTFGEHLNVLLTNRSHNIYGMGKPEQWSREHAQELGSIVYNVEKNKVNVCLDLTGVENKLDLVIGIYLSSYKYEQYKSNVKISKLEAIYLNDQETVDQFHQIKSVLDANHYVRRLSDMPPNKCHSVYIEQEALNMQQDNLNVKVLNEREMSKLGMNALLGVGQGAQMPSRLIVFEYTHPDATNDPVALVGKGVTFDTGGVSLKPADKMHLMKHDMTGAAVVMGTIRAAIDNNLPVNIVGVIAVTENMCSGTAQRPGDVVTAANGKTIEVLNTDAEGRLILADALWYAQTHYKLSCIIDYATLTGAISVALGPVYAGLFSNNNHLADKVIKAGSAVLEPVWRLPIGAKYSNAIKSQIADIQNLGQAGFGAGSSTAAAFLQEFITPDIAWCHLDIAGVSNITQNYFASHSGGATGFGVRLTYEILSQFTKCTKY